MASQRELLEKIMTRIDEIKNKELNQHVVSLTQRLSVDETDVRVLTQYQINTLVFTLDFLQEYKEKGHIGDFESALNHAQRVLRESVPSAIVEKLRELFNM